MTFSVIQTLVYNIQYNCLYCKITKYSLYSSDF